MCWQAATRLNINGVANVNGLSRFCLLFLQDNFGGGLDPAQRYNGRLNGLQIYDRVLSREDVGALLCGTFPTVRMSCQSKCSDEPT